MEYLIKELQELWRTWKDFSLSFNILPMVSTYLVCSLALKLHSVRSAQNTLKRMNLDILKSTQG